MDVRILIPAALGAVLLAGGAEAADWTGEFLLGGALNAGSTLEITQAGQPDLSFDASWETRPFEQPLYWALRLGHEGARHGFALELHHHKIYLENGPGEVQSFSISHGLNFVTGQYRWRHARWYLLALGGAAVAHRESTVRGLAVEERGGLFDDGYELTGPVLGLGGGTTLPLFGILELAAEARLVQSWISVDVAEGRAHTSNFALHLLVGPRIRWSR